LDKAGNPTFLITVDGVDVADAYAVVEGQLRRTVTWDGQKEPAWQHPAGLTVRELTGTEAKQRVFVYSWK
jgi:hypothetical protein